VNGVTGQTSAALHARTGRQTKKNTKFFIFNSAWQLQLQCNPTLQAQEKPKKLQYTIVQQAKLQKRSLAAYCKNPYAAFRTN